MQLHFSRPRLVRFAAFFVAAIFLAALAVGCSKPTTDGAPNDTERQSSEEGESENEGPALPVVNDTSKTLLFSYMDERGQTRTTGSVSEIPPAVRSRVYVVDLSKTPEERQAHKYAFFADLTRKDAAGNYSVVVVSRYDGAKGAASALSPVPDGAVVLYSAQWCGYCKKAKKWFREKNVAFIERDVEKQPGAQQELQDKLKAAGIGAGGIPVIDVAGDIIVGFDQPRLQALLSKMPKEG